MPAKQVQQATFDAIVREGIEEFGLSPEDALADAREQLQKVGVQDFSNIITSIPAAADKRHHDGIALPIAIDSALLAGDDSALTTALHHLAESAAKSEEVCGVAGSEGAVLLVLRALQRGVDLLRTAESQQNVDVARSACVLLEVLCAKNEINRSKFITAKPYDGIAILKTILTELNNADYGMHNPAFSGAVNSASTALLSAISAVQRKSESAKRRVAEGATLDQFMHLIDIAATQMALSKIPEAVENAISLFRKGMLVFRQLLSSDDTTVQVSETFNRARVVCGGKSVMESGLRPLTYDQALPQILHRVTLYAVNAPDLQKADRHGLLTDCIINARLCAISDEICSDVMALGFGSTTITTLRHFMDVVSIVHSCLALLRNIAARDQCKTELFEDMDVVHEAATKHLRSSHAIIEYYAGFIASLCLRRMDLSEKIVTSGKMNAVLLGMQQYEERSSVQRMGCLAVRNACARNQNVRNFMRDEGTAETVVRKAWTLFPRDCDEVAYAALRDLDVLQESETRRDERYTMPAGFFSSKGSSEMGKW